MQTEFDAPTVARLAGLLADPTRVRLLDALRDGPATVSDLGDRLDLPQPRVSTHLALLREAGLVTVEASGRQRAYSATTTALRTLDALAATVSTDAPRRSVQAEREVQRDSSLRRARTCYDHLAGVAGVALLDRLLADGWLQESGGDKPAFQLSPRGREALAARGVAVRAARTARRAFATACLDWTERRPHLGGALGAEILRALAADGRISRHAGSRAVVLQSAIENWLAGNDAQAVRAAPEE